MLVGCTEERSKGCYFPKRCKAVMSSTFMKADVGCGVWRNFLLKWFYHKSATVLLVDVAQKMRQSYDVTPHFVRNEQSKARVDTFHKTSTTKSRKRIAWTNCSPSLPCCSFPLFLDSPLSPSHQLLWRALNSKPHQPWLFTDPSRYVMNLLFLFSF